MASTKKWLIPNDYSELDTEWLHVVLCVPNTRGWRGVVSGAVYNLTRGRFWDEQTGIITVAQNIGLRIFESMTMDCNNDFGRMADSLESLDAKFPSVVTLTEFMDALADAETIEAISEWLGLGTALANIMPHLQMRLTPADWVKLFFEMRWRRSVASSADGIEKWLRTLAMVETGETGAEVAEAVDGWLDNITDWAGLVIQGGGLFAQAASAFALLQGWFSSDGGDEDEALRNINRVYTEVFVEGDSMAVNVNNQQTVNCGSSGGSAGCGDFGSVGFIPDQSPGGTSLDSPGYDPADPLSVDNFPAEFSDFSSWKSYKCKAANAMVLNLAEALYIVSDLRNREVNETTHSLMVQSVAGILTSLDFMFGAGWLYTSQFYTALVTWEAETITDYLYGVPDTTPFNIFSALRLEILNNREDWVCGIYSADSTGDIEAFLVGEANTFITASSYSTEVKAWAVGVFGDMLSSYWLGIPFKLYDNIDGYSDAGAVDCGLVCEGYLYLEGVCTCSGGPSLLPENGDGERDGVTTGDIDTDGWWKCVFSTPVTIVDGMFVQAYMEQTAGTYANWQVWVTIDGSIITIRQLNTIRITDWEGGSLSAYAGQELEDITVVVGDPGPGQDPNFIIDGVRLGGF